MKRLNNIFQVAVIMFLFTGLIGCGTSVKHYKPINKNLNQCNYQDIPPIIKKAREEGHYDKKDRVLYYLDLGLANHYAGNYEESNDNLEKAEHYMQELYTKSLSNIGTSYLTNNNQLPYYGEEYENLYINVFKSLNYENMNKTSEAFVEIRDLYEKISYMELKYRKKAKKYKNSTLAKNLGDKVKDKLNEESEEIEIDSNFSNSALGRYFNYAMYMSDKDLDDAQIGLEGMKKAFAEQDGIYNFSFPQSIIRPQDTTNGTIVHAIALLGNGPIKKQKETRVPMPEIGYLKFVMPELVPRGTSITSVRLYQDGELITELQKVEDVNRVAEAVFKMRKTIIFYKNLLRTVVKEIGGEVSSEVAEEAGGSAAELGVKLASAIYTEVSEQADLRTTRLLPGEFRIATFCLPPGEHDLLAEFSSNGRVVKRRKLDVDVSPGKLNMLELISFH